MFEYSGGNQESVALCKAKKDQLKRARSKSPVIVDKCLRPLVRRNYCQTKTRGKNWPFSEESYAGKMCLEAGITNESQSESLSGEGQSHVSSFDDDSLKIREDGCTSPRDEGTSSSAEIDADDIYKNVNSAMHQHAIDSYSRDSYSDDANQHSPLQAKSSQASTEKMCQACGKVFTDSHKLTVHLKEAHKNSKTAANVCTICDKQLSSSSSLDRHLLVHSGEKPHKCDICGQEFSTNGNMNRHMRTHEKRKISTSSSEGESKMKKRKSAHGNNSKTLVSDDEVHKCESEVKKRKNVHGNKSKTPVSDNEVKMAEVTKHESKVKKQSIHGNNCKTPVFVSEDKEKKAEGQECENNVQKQKSDHGNSKTSVSESKVEKAEARECKKMNYISGFKDLTKLSFSSPNFPLMARIDCEKHQRRLLVENADEVTLLSNNINMGKMCRKCGVCFPCTRSLDKHTEAHNHEHSLICNVCGSAFPSSNEYDFHMLRYSHHGKMPLASTSYFLNQLGLQRVPHVTNEESDHSQTEVFVQNERERTKEKELIMEINKYLEGKKKDSTLCKIRTESSNDFADIPSIVSLTSKSSIPNIRFSPITAAPASPQSGDKISAGPVIEGSVLPQNEMTSTAVSQSVEPNSRTNAQISTSSIEESVSSEQDFEIESSHFFKDFKAGKILCNEDGAKSLKKLKPRSTKKKIHRCEYCIYKSNDKSTVQRHMRTHNGERPFKCSICEYAFTTKANTHRHIRQKHHIPKTNEHKYAVYNTKDKSKSSSEVCPFCSEIFINKRVLQHHLRSSKNSCQNKPWNCLLCNHGFSTKNNCMRHINAQHPGYSNSKDKHIWRNKSISSKKKYEDKELLSLDHNDSDQKENLTINLKTDVTEEQDMPENSNKSDDAELMESSTEANDCATSMFSDSSSQNIGLHKQYSNNDVDPILADHVSQQNSYDSVDQMLVDQISPLHSTPVSQNVAEGCSSLYPETIVNLQINPNDEAKALEALMELSETNQISDDQPLDLSVRPLDLSLNKSVVQHHNNTGVSQRLSDTSEQIANVLEPPPAHTSAFTPKIINFNTTINSNAIDLSQSRIASPTPLFPTQYSIPNHNNTGVSQRLRDTSEQIANVPEPPPAHTSAFTPKITNFNSTIRYNATDLSPSRIVSPALLFPTQYPIPIHSETNSVISAVSSQGETVKEKTTPKKAIECEFCGRLFSTKSNKDRHIRNQHPEFVQSSKHNSSHIPASSELPTQIQNVSESTKNRLRSVLIPKVHNYQNLYDDHDDDSLGSESTLYIVENNPNSDSSNEDNSTDNSFFNDVSKNDYENNDLASVSSVIDTANSQAINKYLKDASLRDEHTPKLHSREDYAVESNMKKDSHEKVKQYACQICKKTFSSSNSRDRHANIHTREIDFACSECNKKFSTKSNLERHKNKSCSKLKNYQNSFSDQLELSKNVIQSLNLSGGSYNKDLSVSDFNRIHANNSPSPMLFSYVNHPIDARDSNADPSLRNINFPFQNLLQKQALECMFCKNTYKNNEDLTNHMKEVHPFEYKSSMGEIIRPEDTRLSFKTSFSISPKRQTSIFRMNNLKKIYTNEVS